jgi:hypothetical protein
VKLKTSVKSPTFRKLSYFIIFFLLQQLNKKMADKYFSTLELTGGTDCQPGLKPDLFVYGGAKITKGLCVGSDLKIKGNAFVNNITPPSSGLKIEGNVCLSGTLTVVGNTNIIIDLNTEYTRLSSFDLVAGNVIIEPTIELNPYTISIVSLPCSGIIVSKDSNGVVTYVPDGNVTPPILDVYQYQGNDYDGISHLVTQLLCSRNVASPPFLQQQGCFNLFDTYQQYDQPGVYPSLVTPYQILALPGSFPIDWSTFTILRAVTGTEPYCTQYSGYECEYFQDFNYGINGFNDDPELSGPGTFVAPNQIVFQSSINATTFTFDVLCSLTGEISTTLTISSPGLFFTPGFGIKLSVRVADTVGLLSNIGTLYITGRTSC